MSKIKKEFSRRAKSYTNSNDVQEKVAKIVLSKINAEPKKILDLGCGSGAICKNITWEYDYFLGVDFSNEMLDAHIKNKNIQLLNLDFNIDDFSKQILDLSSFDIVISSSALQWSKDLNKTLKEISKISKNFKFAIFCDGTFKNIREFLHIQTFLLNTQDVKNSVSRYFDCSFETLYFKKNFLTNEDLFKYIKQSGVSGGENIIGYKKAKELIKAFPYKNLEFEILIGY